MAGIDDKDVLELGGDWKWRVGYTNEALRIDAAGHLVPPGPINEYTVHFQRRAGNGQKGELGDVFDGNIGGWPGVIVAETWYRKQGRVLVRMHVSFDQTIELYSGVHVFYPDDPRGAHVVGGWVNCGGGLIGKPQEGRPYIAWFTMTKVR
jgi:hypothetical protein